MYPGFKSYGLPIAATPSGDKLILPPDKKIRFFNHHTDTVDADVGTIADSFTDLLTKLNENIKDNES